MKAKSQGSTGQVKTLPGFFSTVELVIFSRRAILYPYVKKTTAMLAASGSQLGDLQHQPTHPLFTISDSSPQVHKIESEMRHEHAAFEEEVLAKSVERKEALKLIKQEVDEASALADEEYRTSLEKEKQLQLCWFNAVARVNLQTQPLLKEHPVIESPHVRFSDWTSQGQVKILLHKVLILHLMGNSWIFQRTLCFVCDGVECQDCEVHFGGVVPCEKTA